MIIFDTVGRRSVTFYGCIFQAVFLCLIGALGGKAVRTASDIHGMVASFIIYAAILHMTLGPAAYITAAEVGTSSLREKTMSFSVSLDNVHSGALLKIISDSHQRRGWIRSCVHDSVSNESGLCRSRTQPGLRLGWLFRSRCCVGLALFTRAQGPHA